jgi:hypothetical protein
MDGQFGVQALAPVPGTFSVWIDGPRGLTPSRSHTYRHLSFPVHQHDAPMWEEPMVDHEAVEETLDLSPTVELVGVPEAPWHQFVRERMAQQDGAEPEPDEIEQIEISVAAPRKAALTGIGRFENNLARKGVIDLRPVPGQSGSQSKRDLVGKTTLTFTMGALGPLEMDLIAWTMGQWHRNQDHVSFSLRELARSLGVSWKGQLGASIKNSFLRIKAMTITGRVWDAQEKRHTTQSFNIFDRVEIVEERSSEEGPATRPATVTVVLSQWVVNQLRAGQYSDFEWSGYRSKLSTPFARRLYLLLESEEGTDDGVTWRVPIDDVLGQTLGTNDAVRNPSRFRSTLVAAGKDICAAWPDTYESIRVLAGQRRGEYLLEVRRSRRWREDRIARRRKALADPAA